MHTSYVSNRWLSMLTLQPLSVVCVWFFFLFLFWGGIVCRVPCFVENTPDPTGRANWVTPTWGHWGKPVQGLPREVRPPFFDYLRVDFDKGGFPGFKSMWGRTESRRGQNLFSGRGPLFALAASPVLPDNAGIASWPCRFFEAQKPFWGCYRSKHPTEVLAVVPSKKRSWLAQSHWP